MADRGRALPGTVPSGQALLGVALPSSRDSPGCWMLTNSVRRSGVTTQPVTSLPLGAVRKRLMRPVAGSAHSIWLLPSEA